MTDTAALAKLTNAAKSYARDVSGLIPADSTTEATYYPSVRALISAALDSQDVSFDVRINTLMAKVILRRMEKGTRPRQETSVTILWGRWDWAETDQECRRRSQLR